MHKEFIIDTFYYFNKFKNDYNIEEIEHSLNYFFLQKYKICNTDKYSVLYDRTVKRNEDLISMLYNDFDGICIPSLIDFYECLLSFDIKKKNGVVFTPMYIVEEIISETFSNSYEYGKIIDPACGCGTFLVSVLEYIQKTSDLSFVEIIENNLYGYDIDSGNIERTKYILMLMCAINEEDIRNIKFNIKQNDSLSVSWNKDFGVGFDYVVGNPPYYNTHNMSSQYIDFLKSNFVTTQKGSFNIFYAFIEKGYEELNDNGRLSFIIPNNILSISAAQELREYLLNGNKIIKIDDFGDNMVFYPVRTYNMLLFLEKGREDNLIKYSHFDKACGRVIDFSKRKSIDINSEMLKKSSFIFKDKKVLNDISKIERFPIKLDSMIRVGIATLRDSIYFVKKDSDGFFQYIDDDKIYIETEIVKSIYKVSAIKIEKPIEDSIKYIIFPYKKLNGVNEIITEDELRVMYPNCYKYLLSQRDKLNTRDNGKVNKNGWFAYGRTQGINFTGRKLLYPTFSDIPKFYSDNNVDSLFCNGYAIFETDEIDFEIVKIFLNSNLLKYYVNNTSYAIEGGYFCYQKKYIKNFSFPVLDKEDVELIKKMDSNEIDLYLQRVYGVEYN